MAAAARRSGTCSPCSLTLNLSPCRLAAHCASGRVEKMVSRRPARMTLPRSPFQPCTAATVVPYSLEIDESVSPRRMTWVTCSPRDAAVGAATGPPLVKIVSRWPGWMTLPRSPFHPCTAATVVPYRLEIDESVSPRRITWVTCSPRDAAVGAATGPPLVKIVSRWPGWMMLPRSPFHLRTAATVVPYRLEIDESVSPRRMTWVTCSRDAAVGAAIEPPLVKIVSRWPARMTLPRSPFHPCTAATVVPYRLAIDESVSPRRITWVTPSLAGGVSGWVRVTRIRGWVSWMRGWVWFGPRGAEAWAATTSWSPTTASVASTQIDWTFLNSRVWDTGKPLCGNRLRNRVGIVANKLQCARSLAAPGEEPSPVPAASRQPSKRGECRKCATDNKTADIDQMHRSALCLQFLEEDPMVLAWRHTYRGATATATYTPRAGTRVTIALNLWVFRNQGPCS